jgi:hypothetical protein
VVLPRRARLSTPRRFVCWLTWKSLSPGLFASLVPLAVSQKDWWDQANCGVNWLQQAIDREKVKVEAALNASGRLEFAIELIDFDALAEQE